MNLLRKAYEAAQGPLIRQVSISYGETSKHIRIFTSEGEATEEWRTTVTFSITVVAEKDGLLQTAHEAVSGCGGFEFFDQNDTLAIARKVKARAIQRLSAPPAPSGEMPVVIAAEAGGTLIHEAIGHPLEADAVQKGVSPMYRWRCGQGGPGNRKGQCFRRSTHHARRPRMFTLLTMKAFPLSVWCWWITAFLKRISMTDKRPAGTRSLPTATAAGSRSGTARSRAWPTPLSASKARTTPRKSCQSVPNWLARNGKMGGGQVETATGDFVFEVEEGFLLKDGQVGPLIRGANLLGNGPDVLRTIDMVGSDMGWSVGTCGKEGQGAPVSDGLPTLRIPKGVVVGGIAG